MTLFKACGVVRPSQSAELQHLGEAGAAVVVVGVGVVRRSILNCVNHISRRQGLNWLSTSGKTFLPTTTTTTTLCFKRKGLIKMGKAYFFS